MIAFDKLLTCFKTELQSLFLSTLEFIPSKFFSIIETRADPTTTASANTANNNHEKLVQHLSASSYFIVDSEEKVSSQFYFARAKNNQYNYTTNPSFVDNSGNVNISSFADNPTTFITTVGLYNDNNDLVAVAKLSQPVTKDFTKEALIRVKLDY